MCHPGTIAPPAVRSGPFPWLLALLVLGTSSEAASAQLVHGRVVDEGTGEGVSLARVTVLAGDSVAAGPMTASREGRFRLRLPGPGSYRIQVDRLGYPLHTTLAFQAGPFEEVEVQVALAPEPIPLAPVEVIARGVERGRDQFARRRAAGQGVFVDPIHIALMRDARRIRIPADVVRGVEGIRVGFDGGIDSVHGCITVFVDQNPIAIGRALGGGGAAGATELIPRSPAGEGGRFGGGHDPLAPIPLDQFLDYRQIIAAEVYRSLDEVPREVRAGVRWQDVEWDRCGVVWIWTTTGW
jgi:hypothetical protein